MNVFCGLRYSATPDGVVKRLWKARYGWMVAQAIPETVALFDVSEEVLNHIFDEIEE